MAPSGPRAQRNARGGTTTQNKTAGRPGGIKKRGASGPIRTDRDGDLDMDAAAAAAASGSGRGRQQTNNKSAPPTGPRRSTRSAPAAGGRGPKPTTRAADMVKKIVESGSGNLSSRIAAGIDTSTRHARSSRPINGANTMSLQIGGLKSSKAANNEDGGLRDLVIFLERKASAVGRLDRAVRIKKVSLYIRSNRLESLGGYRATPNLRPVLMP